MDTVLKDTSREEIFSFLKSVFVDSFEVDGDIVTREARLYEDLDIDSIDAIDLMVALKQRTGRKMSPAAFKKVRTVGDIVEAVYNLLQD